MSVNISKKENQDAEIDAENIIDCVSIKLEVLTNMDENNKEEPINQENVLVKEDPDGYQEIEFQSREVTDLEDLSKQIVEAGATMEQDPLQITAEDQTATGSQSKSPFPGAGCKRKRKDLETVENVMMGAYKILKSMPAKTPEDTDYCGVYTQFLATKLRVFDKAARQVLMNEIDSLVLRTARRQKLRPNEPPPFRNSRYNF